MNLFNELYGDSLEVIDKLDKNGNRYVIIRYPYSKLDKSQIKDQAHTPRDYGIILYFGDKSFTLKTLQVSCITRKNGLKKIIHDPTKVKIWMAEYYKAPKMIKHGINSDFKIKCTKKFDGIFVIERSSAPNKSKKDKWITVKSTKIANKTNFWDYTNTQIDNFGNKIKNPFNYKSIDRNLIKIVINKYKYDIQKHIDFLYGKLKSC